MLHQYCNDACGGGELVVCVCIERTRLFAIAANWRSTIWRASKLFKSKASAVVVGGLSWYVVKLYMSLLRFVSN